MELSNQQALSVTKAIMIPCALLFQGVALLAIAHWKPIEEIMTSRDMQNEVFTARCLAAGHAPLGLKYRISWQIAFNATLGSVLYNYVV